MSKTHWKSGVKSPYLGAWDLTDYNDKNATIQKVVRELTDGLPKNEVLNVAYFVEDLKPMVINATNSKRIAKITGSSFIDDWNNVEVTLYVQKDVKTIGGEYADGLRIRHETKVKKNLTPDLPMWQTALFRLSKGTLTREKIEANWKISDENWNKLVEESKKPKKDE